jgi:ribosomal protein uL22
MEKEIKGIEEKRGEKKEKEEKESGGEREEEKEEKKVGEEKKVKEKEKKEEKVKKKDFAIAKAYDLPISTKKAVAICKAIKNLNPKEAINLLEDVRKLKKAIPMSGEIPHRKKGQRLGKNVQGRFPSKAAKYFIKILKQAIANAVQLGFDEDKIYISKIKADKGSTIYRPGRFFGRKFKRTNIYIEIREK